jgi:hypothetical protein
MINSLFSFTPTIPLTDEQRAAFAQVSDWVEVPECKPGTYQSYVANIEMVDAIHAQLTAMGNARLIGVWNTDGTQYGFERQVMIDENDNIVETVVQIEDPLTHPLDRQAYLDALLDAVTYDANGQELSRTRPTELKPVNKFAGMADRIL